MRKPIRNAVLLSNSILSKENVGFSFSIGVRGGFSIGVRESFSIGVREGFTSIGVREGFTHIIRNNSWSTLNREIIYW